MIHRIEHALHTLHLQQQTKDKDKATSNSSSASKKPNKPNGKHQAKGKPAPTSAAATNSSSSGAAAAGGSTAPAADERERVLRLAEFQKKMLAHALSFPRVRFVVYSTCSVHPVCVGCAVPCDCQLTIVVSVVLMTCDCMRSVG
jgi:hypothetical protein